MIPKSLSNLLRISVSFLVIALIVYFLRDKISHAVEILKTDVNWNYFVAAIGLYVLVLGLLAYRLKTIWDLQKIEMPYRKVLHISVVSLFFNFFLPSAVGGDIVKVYYASKHHHSKLKAGTSVVVDRLLGFVAIMILANTAMIFYTHEIKNPAVSLCVYVFSAILAVCIFFFINTTFAKRFKFLITAIPSAKVRDFIRQIYNAATGYAKHPRIMFALIGLSVVIQFILVCFYALLAHSLNNPLALPIFCLVVPVTTIVSMIPSIGGLGVREAGSIFLLSQYMTEERALALTILADMIIYGAGLVGGLIFACFGHKQFQLIQKMESFDAP